MKQLYNPQQGPMKVALALSSQGSNVKGLFDVKNPPYKIVAVITDTPGERVCDAFEIVAAKNLEYCARDVDRFYSTRNVNPGLASLDEKKELLVDFYPPIDAFLSSVGVDCIVYDGFKSPVTDPLLGKYLNVNLLYADIQRLGNTGRPEREMVKTAVLAGHKSLKGTVHLITPDSDPIIYQTSPLPVNLNGYDLDKLKKNYWSANAAALENYDRLDSLIKNSMILPYSLEALAEGRLYLDENTVVEKGEEIA